MSRKSLQICIYLAVAAWESLEPLLPCLQRRGRLAFPLPVCKQHLWFANRISLCQPSHPVPRSFLVVCPIAAVSSVQFGPLLRVAMSYTYLVPWGIVPPSPEQVAVLYGQPAVSSNYFKMRRLLAGFTALSFQPALPMVDYLQYTSRSLL